MVKPTVGRLVRYFPSKADTFPTPAEGAAAIVTQVLSEETVNLVVFDSDGHRHSEASVSQKTEDNVVHTWDWPPR